jgi:hypothetical protein
VNGKGNRRGRDAGPDDGGRADRPGGFARKDEDEVPLRNLSTSADSRNGQLIRHGRSARGRLHPVRPAGTAGRRARSGGVTWIVLALLLLVLVGAAVWFFFLRDGGGAGALLVIGGRVWKPNDKKLRLEG